MIHTTVAVICDLCEKPDASELRFTVQGKALTLDLCDSHRQQWNAALGPFIGGARPAPKRVGYTAHRVDRPSNGATYDIAGLRAWAAAHDVVVPQRGRIPQTIRDQYEVWSRNTAARRSS